MGKKQKRILIIEDEMETADLLRTLLTLNQFDVQIANGGKEGLHIAQTHAPDLILLDILMPNMDGWEVHKRLKGHPDTHHTPIIFLTAESKDLDKIRGLHVAKASGYITKPFSSEQLLTQIQEAIQ